MTQNQSEDFVNQNVDLNAFLQMAGVKAYGPSEVANLRKAGKLEEAYEKGKVQLVAEPENIWSKRDMAWVLYSFLKVNHSPEKFDTFHGYIKELAALNLPNDEKMLFDQVSWQIGKVIFALLKNEYPDVDKVVHLLEDCKNFHFTQPSEGYSFLFKAFHKALKDHPKYLSFADWWGLNNFKAEDYQKEKLPNGKEVMSVAEQAYIAYSKHLLPKYTHSGEMLFDREKVLSFIPLLDQIIEAHPEYQYPGYFKAKLLLALGDQENLLSALLPFARKKRNDFWVWDVLSEAFPDNEQKQVACYCRALTCKTSDDFLIKVRQKMAGWFISNYMFNEAKTEIDRIVKARQANEWKLPAEVQNWIAQSWYKTAMLKSSNLDFYNKYLSIADHLLYADIPEETVLIDFVNTNKKIANFIASEQKFGFFKYDRFVDKLDIGDTLRVRFQNGSKERIYQVLTATKINDEEFKKNFFKTVEGNLRLFVGKPFGFLDDVFVHPALVAKHHLTDGLRIKANAIKSYNQKKKEWSWKAVSI